MIGLEFIATCISLLAIGIAAYTYYKTQHLLKNITTTNTLEYSAPNSEQEKIQIKEEIIERINKAQTESEFITLLFNEWQQHKHQGFSIKDFDDIRKIVDFHLEHKPYTRVY